MRLVVAPLIVAVVALGSVLDAPVQASAATGELEISSDNVTFGSTYPGVLFDDVTHMVPGDSQGKSFFLRNSGTEAGFLRLVLSGVTSSDRDFAEALQISASTASYPGIASAISQANPCWVLAEGQTVAPGEVVEVETLLALDDLDGLAGQGATASLTIRAVLSDTTTGSLPPTSCKGPGIDVPVAPGPRPTATSAPVQPNTQVVQPGATVEKPQTEPGGDLPVLNLPGGIVIDPNTWDLREELLILLLVGSFLAGAAWFVIAARKRRHNTEDEAETTT